MSKHTQPKHDGKAETITAEFTRDELDVLVAAVSLSMLHNPPPPNEVADRLLLLHQRLWQMDRDAREATKAGSLTPNYARIDSTAELAEVALDLARGHGADADPPEDESEDLKGDGQ